LAIRQSSPLFRLQTGSDIMARLQFHNTGPEQIPGLIVMSLSDKVADLPDLDPHLEQIIGLFNATDSEQSLTLAGLAGQGFHLHPIQANSADSLLQEASFDPQTGTFTAPARATAVFVQGEQATTITIVKQATPQSRRNFRFSGDLGHFRLDDPLVDDGDAIPNSITFTVEPGTYRIREELPGHWYATGIQCDNPERAAANLAQAELTLILHAGDQLTCTFHNGFGATLWTRKYHDRNGDGSWLGDKGLKDWEIQLYDDAGQLQASANTNGNGKANFWFVRPGRYSVCERQQEGWTNTQPGTLDPAFDNNPCYSVELAPGQLVELFFGNSNGPTSAPNVGSAAAPLIRDAAFVDDEDEGDYNAGRPFLDPDIDLPGFGDSGLYLPSVSR
jgi:hypothetical protein